MFEEMKDLPEKFGQVFAEKSMQMVARTCNFHIGVAPNGELTWDVNGTNPELVARGFFEFSKALKKVGLTKKTLADDFFDKAGKKDGS